MARERYIFGMGSAKGFPFLSKDGQYIRDFRPQMYTEDILINNRDIILRSLQITWS